MPGVDGADWLIYAPIRLTATSLVEGREQAGLKDEGRTAPPQWPSQLITAPATDIGDQHTKALLIQLNIPSCLHTVHIPFQRKRLDRRLFFRADTN